MPNVLLRPEPAPLLAPGETVVLFDGVCKLCNGWARFLIRYDHRQRVRMATVQSPEGQALLAWAGLPLEHFETMAVIRDRYCWLRSDAFFEVLRQLPGAWPLLRVFKLLPVRLRDISYQAGAKSPFLQVGDESATAKRS